MQPCLMCGQPTCNVYGYCDEECYDAHQEEIALYDADTVAGEPSIDDELVGELSDADTLADKDYGGYDCDSGYYDGEEPW